MWGSNSHNQTRGGEWYLEKRVSRKILAGSRKLGSVFDKSRSLVFSWFVFTFFEPRNFLPKSLGLGFLTRISAYRRVSDFTIRHASNSVRDSYRSYLNTIIVLSRRHVERNKNIVLLTCKTVIFSFSLHFSLAFQENFKCSRQKQTVTCLQYCKVLLWRTIPAKIHGLYLKCSFIVYLPAKNYVFFAPNNQH